MISLHNIYFNSFPVWLNDFISCDSFQRIKFVGMNCGCEYTSFPQFNNIDTYSRFDHSLGTALIVWNFTNDIKQSLAALFHDIATPVFAHTIDFLNGDYLTQESTEELTFQFIASDSSLIDALNKYNISIADISDYHRYPIADNDSPKLSSDRLEYTCGNIVNYKFGTYEDIALYYNDIYVDNIDGVEELSFKNIDIAEKFACDCLKCSRIYVSDEDRYSMQILSDIVSEAIHNGVLSYNDLYTTEENVISKLRLSDIANKWNSYTHLSRMLDKQDIDEDFRIVYAKKRYIDPYVYKKGRLSTISEVFKTQLDDFLDLDFSKRISAE